MKIWLVIDETRFHQPNFVAKFLSKTTDEIVGAALVTKIPQKNSLDAYLKKHWYYLKLSEMAKLIFEKYTMAIKDSLLKSDVNKPFYSVRSVLKFFNIDFVEVEYNINKEKYIKRIKEKKPDVLISSNSLIFKEELLGIPKICCLNRHSSLLPSYGGLFPVFQAFINGESFTGVSVHTMEKTIDKGRILSQKEIPIEKNDTINDLYKKCFELSAGALLEALERLKSNDYPTYPYHLPSYFSFPTKVHWKEFRLRGGKFI